MNNTVITDKVFDEIVEITHRAVRGETTHSINIGKLVEYHLSKMFSNINNHVGDATVNELKIRRYDIDHEDIQEADSKREWKVQHIIDKAIAKEMRKYIKEEI